MKVIRKTYRVYGAEGHRQRESFCRSYRHDFSSPEEGIRILDVRNSDATGTNMYTELQITRNTEEQCDWELEGQLSDGIFENSNTGRIEEISVEEVDIE